MRESFLKVKMASMIIYDSSYFYDQLIADIERAKNSIEFEVYIWEADHLAEKIEEALLRAVKRGVRVRVIVDRIGSFDWIMKKQDVFVAQGLDIRVFRPAPRVTTLAKFFPATVPLIFTALNRRNHRKVYVIDEVAYIGSQNIMAAALNWQETNIRIEDPDAIQLIRDIFESTWKWIKDDRVRFRNIDFQHIISGVQNSDTVRTTQTQKLRRLFRQEICRLVDSAQKRVWLVTPYFNPPRYFLQAIVNAAKRGVDVCLIVPKINDIPWYNYLSKLYYAPLIKRGVRIFEYEKCILHSKASLIDDLGSIGSANLNYRSFYQDLEMNVLISDKRLIDVMEKQFLSDLEHCGEFLDSNRIPLWERMVGSFLTLFKTSF